MRNEDEGTAIIMTKSDSKKEEKDFQFYVDAYMEYLRLSGHASNTRLIKKSHVDNFIRWCGHSVTTPADITLEILLNYQHFVNSLKKNKVPLSIRTRYNKVSNVLNFFTFLHKKGHILYNPADGVDLPRAPRRLPMNVLSPEECKKIMAVPNVNVYTGLRNRAILEVLYSTGLRLKEFLNLELCDIDYRRGILLVRQGKGNKDRYVPIGDSALAWLKKYVKEVRPVFISENATAKYKNVLFLTSTGKRFTSRIAEMLLERIIKKSGVKKKGSFLLFRHSLATGMLENGADIRYIQQVLGHKRLETTQIYTHVSIAKLKEVHEKTHPGSKNDEDIRK